MIRYSKFIGNVLSEEHWQMILKRKDMWIASFLLIMLVSMALIAPWVSPEDPNAADLQNKNMAPSYNHLLGTDYLGRDILSRIMVAAHTSLLISFGVVLISLFIGVSLGCLAGYYEGHVDEIISRLIDVFLSFPGIIFALTVMSILGTGVLNLIIALSIVQWASYARLMRGQVLSVKKNEYVLSSKMVGNSDIRTIRKHIVPNCIAPVLVLATIDLGHVILSISALSFLGIGLPSEIPEWGAMLNAGKACMRTSPYQTVFPGMAITVFVVLFSILGDGIRDILDPQDKGGDLY
jgi:peptide/nickel transport system permease protein